MAGLSIQKRGHSARTLIEALCASVLCMALACLCASFCMDRACALETGGLAGSGSITVHKYRTASTTAQPGSGTTGDAALLPSDAVPVDGVTYRLFALDTALVEGSGAPAVSGAPAASGVAAFLGTYAAPGVSPASPTASGATGSGSNPSGELAFGSLPFGYYLLVEDASSATGGSVTTAPPMLVTLPYANAGGSFVQNVHVYPKSASTEHIAKTREGAHAVAGLGDTVPWKVSFPVPGGLKTGSGASASYGHDWSVSDALDARLDWAGTWQVALKDSSGAASSVTLTPGTDIVCTYNPASHEVEWAIADAATKTIVDNNVASLEITFDTTVNEKALANVEPVYNDAAIDFVNATGDPFHHAVIGGAPDPDNPAHPRAYLGAIIIDKHLDDMSGPALAGAEFALAASEADARAGVYMSRTVAGAETLAVATDAQGAAAFSALAPGTYWVVETKAPSYTDGSGNTVQCARLSEPVEVVIEDSADGAHRTVQAVNRAETPADVVGGMLGSLGSHLPKTGDAAWWILLVLLAAAATAAAAGARRRAKKQRQRGETVSGSEAL